MPTSDLTSLVPPQFSHSAASEESWHRSSSSSSSSSCVSPFAAVSHEFH